MNNISANNVSLVYSLYALGKKPSGEGGGSGEVTDQKTLYELALEIGYAGSESQFSKDFNNVMSNKLISPDGSARVTVKNAETIIKGLVDPIDLLDAVNLQTLQKYIADSEKETQKLIDELEKKITDVGNCQCDPEVLAKLAEDVSDLLKRVEALEKEVADIKQSIVDLKTDLEGQISDLRSELVLLIGESEKKLLQMIKDLEKKHDKDITDLNDLLSAVNTKVQELELKHDKDIADLNQSLTDLEEKHDLDVSELKDSIKDLEDKHDKDIQAVNKRIDELELLHKTDIENLGDEITQLKTENAEIKQTIIDLTEKHDKEVADLQEQIDNLENSVITAINNYMTIYLPKMIEEEVKKQLEGLELGSCDCKDPDVIDGNLWPETEVKTDVVVFDNGKANSKDFDYIMKTPNDPAVTVINPRIAYGGDANDNDENPAKYMTFEEWLEKQGLTTVYNGGSAETKNNIYNTWIYNGGSATSGY